MMDQIDNYVFISIAVVGLLVFFFLAKAYYQKNLLKDKLSKNHNRFKN